MSKTWKRRLRCAWWVLRGRSVMFRVVVAHVGDQLAFASFARSCLMMIECSFNDIDFVTGEATETIKQLRERSSTWLEDPQNDNRYGDAWMRGE